VKQIGFDFQPEVERMAYLFFEEGAVLFFDDGTSDLELQIRLWEDQGQLHAEAKLVKQGEPQAAAQYQQPVPAGKESTALHKKSKQTVLHAVHDCLANYTGSGQPWGILTGIRPMKLVHSMLEQGWSRPAIQNQLAETYRLANDRIQLLLDIADAQLEAVPDLYHLSDQASLYIGIPFCPTHCAYCTFPAYSME
jgi:oxygen-independent coproporphyrinogen-3 oxidase